MASKNRLDKTSDHLYRVEKLVRQQHAESRRMRAAMNNLAKSLRSTGARQTGGKPTPAERHRQIFARMQSLGHRRPRTLLKLPRQKLYALARRFDDPSMTTGAIAKWFAKTNPDHPAPVSTIYRTRKLYAAIADSIDRGESLHDMIPKLPKIS